MQPIVHVFFFMNRNSSLFRSIPPFNYVFPKNGKVSFLPPLHMFSFKKEIMMKSGPSAQV